MLEVIYGCFTKKIPGGNFREKSEPIFGLSFLRNPWKNFFGEISERIMILRFSDGIAAEISDGILARLSKRILREISEEACRKF